MGPRTGAGPPVPTRGNAAPPVRGASTRRGHSSTPSLLHAISAGGRHHRMRHPRAGEIRPRRAARPPVPVTIRWPDTNQPENTVPDIRRIHDEALQDMLVPRP